MIMLDTHVAANLYEGRGTRLSTRTRGLLNSQPAYISPAVLFELEILHEIGRTRFGGLEVARYLTQELDIQTATEPFAAVVKEALALAFTRDPFDRLIVAHAALLKAPLVTFDERIQKHYRLAMS
jgi:PIN domain nuclease of toxin-antitoxin system